LKDLNETQLWAIIESNIEIVDPKVANRAKVANSLNLTVYSDLIDQNRGFWNQSLIGLENVSSVENDRKKNLSMLRDMAATTYGMVWDEKERSDNPNITISDVKVTDSAFGLELKIGSTLLKANTLLLFGSVKKLTEGNLFWSHLYFKVSLKYFYNYLNFWIKNFSKNFLMSFYLFNFFKLSKFYFKLYNEAIHKTRPLNEPQKSRELTAIYRDIDRLFDVITTSSIAIS
jgi:hypothetical protein